MKPAPVHAFVRLVFGCISIWFLVLASNASGAAQVDQLVATLRSTQANPDEKLEAAWQLGELGTEASAAVPALVAVVESEREHRRSRLSALNALGHIGVHDTAVAERVVRMLTEQTNVFRGAGGAAVINGDFEAVADLREGAERGQFGETMFEPGSLDLIGWTAYRGMIGFQDEGARPGGRNALELGPRDLPGCISQTVRTEVGKPHEVTFHACGGRNTELTVRVGQQRKTFTCPRGRVSQRFTFPFVAESPLTTITFCGEGGAGFGPFMDDVSIAPAGQAPPATVDNDDTRRERLDQIARRLASESPEPIRRGPADTFGPVFSRQEQGMELLSDAGRSFVGHQFDHFERLEPGVIGTTKPAWISLYQTEQRDFTLSGEVCLGGRSDQLLYPGDLPDGFALFLREWDGIQRYQLDSRKLVVKRRQFHGQATTAIKVVTEFAPPKLNEWLPFRARVSGELIEYSFAGNTGRLFGPLDTDGANKIAIAPGTKLRNLRLTVAGVGLASENAVPRSIFEQVTRAGGLRGEGGGRGQGGGGPFSTVGRPPPTSIKKLEAVPDGEYQAEFGWFNQKQTLTIKVRAQSAEVTKSSDDRIAGSTGQFQRINDGAFRITLRKEPAVILNSQIWWPLADGSFDIREIPDRGEQQRAVPVGKVP